MKKESDTSSWSPEGQGSWEGPSPSRDRRQAQGAVMWLTLHVGPKGRGA